jgi:GNAT superfamily N-acetyltransferase
MVLPERIRVAAPDDVDAVVRMVRELAEHQRKLDQVRATPDQLAAALFGDDPAAAALIAEVDGAPAGFALWYRTFSTWEGVPGIHLEDLYVAEEHRGSGLGRELPVALARIALDRGWTRLEWDVLRWNTPSIAFYDSLGAEPLDDGLGYRLAGPALAELGA